MSATPSHDEILAALGQAGYMLEQEVASALERLGFRVATNAAFLDPEEDKSREIDVLAYKDLQITGDLRCRIELVVECKHNAYPLVFLTRPRRFDGSGLSPREIVFPTDYLSQGVPGPDGSMVARRVPHFTHFGLDHCHYAHGSNYISTQLCAILRKGASWEAVHGGVIDGITFPLAKASEARMTAALEAKDGHSRVHIQVPLVVVTGEIFTLDTTVIPSVLVPVPHATLVRTLQTRALRGTYSFDFTRASELTDFVLGPLETFIRRLVEVARMDSSAIISGALPDREW